VRIWWANLRRVAHVAAVVLVQLLAWSLDRWRRRLGRAALSAPERLRRVFEELGGTFLKLGQMLALQPDILPPAYCDALFDLMDRVPPFGFAEVERIVREELGGTPDELFDRFARRPLATASIGQVHRAALAGRDLAVKVQRPAVESEFRSDLRLLRMGMRLIAVWRLRRFEWLLDPLTEFVAWTREELDYRYEAHYAECLRANAADNPAERVPALVAERSTRRLLTVEFLAGTTVLDYLRARAERDPGDRATLERVRAGGFDPDTFARNVVDNFLGDAFRHGIFHADLHPANLMILPGNVVGYIDFGITAVLSPYSRRHLVALTLAYTRGDLDGMCDAFFKVSSFAAGADPGAFRAGLKRFTAEWYGGDARGVRLRKNFTLVMLDMLNLSRSTGILPERDVVKYIRSAIAIDGLITRFAPGFDLGRHLAAVCERYLRLAARQALWSDSRWLDWAGAGTHLLHDGAFRAAAALERLSAAGPPAAAGSRPRRGDPGAALDGRALRLAAIAFGAAVLMSAGHGAAAPAALGANLFTAETLLFTLSLALLVRTVRRLPGGADKEAYHA
jgi:ubiquinone biosynthesis protein